MIDRRRTVAAGAAAVVLCAGYATRFVTLSAQRGAQPAVTLSIVGTSDLHGGLLPKDGRGGLALLAGYVSNLREARARDGGAVLLVDAGDMFQGTIESNLAEGAPVVEAYNAMGYTAAAIGNHEFDFGPAGPAATAGSSGDDPRGALKARAAQARFPLLAANVLDESTGRPVKWPNVTPSVIVQAAGVKVGIIGVVTRDTSKATVLANVGGLRFAPLAGTIAAEAFRLRLGGATVVIVAAHAGGSCTNFDEPADLSSCRADDEIMEVARALPASLVDGIVAGHTHAGMAHEVHGIAITEAYSGGRSFGRVDFEIDPMTKRVAEKRIFAPHGICDRENPKTHDCDPLGDKGATLVPATYEGKPVVADEAITKIIAPAIARAAPIKARRLGAVLDTPIRRAALRGGSPLGHLFVDSLRSATPGADVAIYDADGLHTDLPMGPLTYGSLFEVSPLENMVVRLHLTGAGLRAVLAAQLERRSLNALVSGLRVQATCAAGALKVTLLRPSGRPIEDGDEIVVATDDFLAAGGTGMFAAVIPPQGFAIPDDAPIAREVVAEWLERRGGHLREDKLVDSKKRRWEYPGTLPVTCASP